MECNAELLRKIEEKRNDPTFREEAEKNNHANSEWIVKFPYDNHIVDLPYCSCCMAKTTGKVEMISLDDIAIGCGVNDDKLRDFRIKMPICEKCLKHRKQGDVWLYTVMGICIGVGLLLCLVCRVWLEASFVAAYFYGFACYLALIILLTSVVRLPKLDSSHCTRFKPVKAVVLPQSGSGLDIFQCLKRGPYLGISFMNWEFAFLFFMANARQNIVLEENPTKDKKLNGTIRSFKSHISGSFLAGGFLYSIVFLLLKWMFS